MHAGYKTKPLEGGTLEWCGGSKPTVEQRDAKFIHISSTARIHR